MTANVLRGAVLALLACSLFCAHRASASATCTPTVNNPSNTVHTYNNCTQVCCADQVRPAAGYALQDCCHDSATSFCPAGMKCCTPTPAVTVNPKPRACYSEDLQGCCSWQLKPTYAAITFAVTNTTYTAKTFFKDESQCCTAPNNGYYDYPSNSDLIAPKYVTSCTKYLAELPTPKYFSCYADGDCPTGNKCCRRPQQATETSTDIYNAFGAGKCYDPTYFSCCGGGTGIKRGSNTTITTPLASANTFIEAELYNPNTQQCCTLPTYAPGHDLPRFVVSLSGVPCPCLATTDCPSVGTTNFTCCAPSEAIMTAQGANGVTKRFIKCDAGCPANSSVAAVTAPSDPRSGYFEGCLGQCIPSSTSNRFEDKVCLVGSALGNRCDNLRRLDGKNIVPPEADKLVVSDAEAHWTDCCPSGADGKSFSLLYNTRKELCCPVIGTRYNGSRFLAPTVTVQDFSMSLSDQQERCMCAGDSDCPNGQTCCAGANSLLSNRLAALNYGNYTGLCYDARLTSCCAYKKGYNIAVGQLYNPASDQCCSTGVTTVADPCGCHSDAECTAPNTACCTGAVRYGNGTHGVGQCYDTRTQSCCQYYVRPTVSNVLINVNMPIEDSRITGTPTVSQVYDNTTKVCCKWNGVQDSINNCTCRHDRSDCPGSSVCCASNGTQAAFQGQGRYSLGVCINSQRQGCCTYKWMNRTAPPTFYDKQREVCCPNNGVAKDHRGCQCASNAECPASGECCLDAQAAENDVAYQCPNANSTCPGRCVHTALETCCDDPFVSEFANYGNKQVKACAKESQKCCNGQCCNKATQTCKKTSINKHKMEISPDKTSAFMTNSYGYHYGLDKESKQCTTDEHSSPSIVFHTWVFPAFLSIAGLVFIAIGTKHALGADITPNLVKLGMVGISVFVGIMSLLLLWSPLWKYGFVIVVANAVILSAFAVGGAWPKRFAVAVAVVCFLWVVEPFGSNSILNFGTTTFAGGKMNDLGANGNWYNAHGLNYAARLLQRPRDSTEAYDACTAFYQYWMVDDGLHDTREWNPQGATRGICRRSWMHTITVMAGLITPFQTIFLVLAGLALARGGESANVKVQPA